MKAIDLNCPCIKCIVRAACNMSCTKEVRWYFNLTSSKQAIYRKSKHWKNKISAEAAEAVAEFYNLDLSFRK